MSDEFVRLEKDYLQQLGDAVALVPRNDGRAARCPDHSLLTSAWQKAIRRGDAAQALACANALWQQDPKYIWRRIRGIALEEVSLADVVLVGTVLCVAGKQVLLRRLGEYAVLEYLVMQLCAAPKARTACDLLVWVNCHPEADGLREMYARAPSRLQWLHELVAPVRSLQRAAVIAQLMAGYSVREVGRWRAVSRAEPRLRDAWLEAWQVPWSLRYVACRGGSTDALNLLLVLTWKVCAAEGPVNAMALPADASEESIGGVPAYAYCLFSRPGREALQRFLQGDAGLARELGRLRVHDPVRALGWLVFEAQGSYCARVLALPGAARIRERAYRAALTKAGIPRPAIPALQAQLQQAWPAINCNRQEVARRHGWAS